MAASLIEIAIAYFVAIGKILLDPELTWVGKIVTIPIYTVVFVFQVIINTMVVWGLVLVLFLILGLLGFF